MSVTDNKVGTCIKYRRVINDACAFPWEEMPEIQPPTLQGLADYLKTCPGWDYTRLSTTYQGWDKHQVSYGPRVLFWIPVPPLDEEFTWPYTDYYD
jgi:hypothetical protein